MRRAASLPYTSLTTTRMSQADSTRRTTARRLATTSSLPADASTSSRSTRRHTGSTGLGRRSHIGGRSSARARRPDWRRSEWTSILPLGGLPNRRGNNPHPPTKAPPPPSLLQASPNQHPPTPPSPHPRPTRQQPH